MLKRFWGLTLLVLLGVAPLAADNSKSSYPVEFHTFPGPLWVYRYHPENADSRQDDCLGQTDQKLYLDASEQEMKDDWLIYFAYVPRSSRPDSSQLDNLRPQLSDMLHIRVGQLAGTGRYPLEGVYRPALTSAQWVNYFLYAIGLRFWWAWLSLGAFVGLTAHHYWRRWRTAHQALRREDQRSALTADMFRGDPLEGQQLGDYLLLARVGEGAMGIVYRAVPQADPDPARQVAIKLIRGLDESQRRRFFHECRVYQRFRHINILTVLETGIADVSGICQGWPYLVSEFIQGHSLRQVIETHPTGVPLRMAASYLVQLMRGLTHAHQTGVIHRDIKPENVLLSNDKTPDGFSRIVLMDFGLARSADQPRLTAVGDILGTPQYMSPEQLRGEPVEASDQYAVGMLAYEMLCGSLPFKGDNPAQIIMQQLHYEPKSLALLKPNLPDTVVESVHRMLNKDPDLRYHHMADVTAAWETLAGPRAAKPRPDSPL